MEPDNLPETVAIGFISQEPQLPQPQLLLKNFANSTAEKIRQSLNCNFSQLSHQELVQCVTSWHESCAQAMLRYDDSMIDQWVRKQVGVAADRGFELEDLLELLRICRRSAMEVERWNEDAISPADDVINDVLRRGVGKGFWTIPADLDYLIIRAVNPAPVGPAVTVAELIPPAATAAEVIPPTATATEEIPMEPPSERRAANRARLSLPIRVCGYGLTGYHLDLELHAENFSCNGLYFVANEPFAKGLQLQVTCPYPHDDAEAREEFSAKVVRVDRRTDRSRGIALQFLDPMAPNEFQERVLQFKPDRSRRHSR